MSNFDKGFDRSFNFVRTFIFIVFALVIAGFIFRGVLVGKAMSNGEKLYEITVPDYNGSHTSYITKHYSINKENGCVTFKDEFGFKQTICNNFNITEY